MPELRLRGTVAFAPASHLDDAVPARRSQIVARRAAGSAAIIALGLRGDRHAPTRRSACRRCSRRRRAALYPQTETICYDALSGRRSFGGLPLNQILKLRRRTSARC